MSKALLFCMINVFSVLIFICLVFKKIAKILKLNPEVFIMQFIQKIEYQIDRLWECELSKNHTNCELVFLDIGSRGGELEIIRKNKHLFEKIILVEGEENEAKILKDKGYLIIDKFLSNNSNTTQFYHIKNNPGASSLKKPLGAYFDLYSPDENYYNMHMDYELIEVETSTVDDELSKLNIDRVDFIKIDTQGSEYDIINGIQKYQPLFWNIEIQHLPMYHDTPFGVDIIKELQTRGYIMFHLTDKKYRGSIDMQSDGLFMPNWEDETGKKNIINNLEKWELLMQMFSQDYLLDFIKNKLRLMSDNR